MAVSLVSDALRAAVAPLLPLNRGGHVAAVRHERRADDVRLAFTMPARAIARIGQVRP